MSSFFYLAADRAVTIAFDDEGNEVATSGVVPRPIVAGDWVLTTESQYSQENQRAAEQSWALLTGADVQYNAWIGRGVSAATASALTGYVPPLET